VNGSRRYPGTRQPLLDSANSEADADRVQQLAHAMADQADGVLGHRPAEHRGGIKNLLDSPVEQPELLRELQRAFQRDALEFASCDGAKNRVLSIMSSLRRPGL
jgi:hypothetical protein